EAGGAGPVAGAARQVLLRHAEVGARRAAVLQQVALVGDLALRHAGPARRAAVVAAARERVGRVRGVVAGGDAARGRRRAREGIGAGRAAVGLGAARLLQRRLRRDQRDAGRQAAALGPRARERLARRRLDVAGGRDERVGRAGAARAAREQAGLARRHVL